MKLKQHMTVDDKIETISAKSTTRYWHALTFIECFNEVITKLRFNLTVHFQYRLFENNIVDCFNRFSGTKLSFEYIAVASLYVQIVWVVEKVIDD